MQFRNPILCTLALTAALLAPEAASAAKYSIRANVSVDGAQTKVVVTLSSTKKVASKYAPNRVKVKAAGKTIKLGKIKSTKGAYKYLTTWQSKNQTGSYAGKLKGLNGKRVTVTATARTGKMSKRVKASVTTAPIAGGGGAGKNLGAGPIFTAPGSTLIGIDAWNLISPHFQNSAFSDCAGGPWPMCAVEERYVHCPNFSWRYMRTSGYGSSDINSYGNYTEIGVSVYADGSWAISYDTNTGAHYLWQGTNTSGLVNGTYQYGTDPAQNLGQFYWSKPATTWDQLSGAC